MRRMTMALYEQLGGEGAVNAAVDIFYRKVLTDDRISHFFDDVDMERQAAKQRAFLTYAFGGPNHYKGKDMRAAPAHLIKRGQNEEHFNAVAGHLKSTLQELNAPANLIDEVLAIAASTHDDALDL
jgi:hemoglobin